MYLYGASSHAKAIAELLLENGTPINGVFDDYLQSFSFNNLPFLGLFEERKVDDETIIAIGNNLIRKHLSNQIKVTWGKAISKDASISPYATIGEGTVVFRNASVCVDASIGRHVILGTNCSVDHDCIISDFVHLSPNAALAGNIFVGEGSFIGTGACIIPGIKIGKWTTIGAGTVVIRDVPDYVTVVGNPGKIIKCNPIHNQAGSKYSIHL